MQLVGAPLGFVRGPFVAEGVLQGGGGAMVAVDGAVGRVHRRAGPGQRRCIGVRSGWGRSTFLPLSTWLVLVAGGMLCGCAGRLDVVAPAAAGDDKMMVCVIVLTGC